MEFEIKNCNNLDYAKIEIFERKLNIKFAPNGTGKSTIAKAIQYSLESNGSSLNELIPFKFRKNNPDNFRPQVIGTEQIKNIMCFNEDYVNNIVFQTDELVLNSFDIFIRNDNYKRLEREIELIVQKIKSLFANNTEIETLILNLNELGSAFRLTKTGISKASTGMRGLAGGNKIQHIPDGLELFSPFIKSDKNVDWIDWQIKGYEFTDLANSCPFCTSDATEKKDQIKKVGKEYDKTTIKNLIGLINIIKKLGDYFSESTKLKLNKITTLKDGLESEHEEFLASIKTQIDNFLNKLGKIKALSGFDFNDGEKVSEKLQSYKLDLQFFELLDSDKTKEAVRSINESIDDLIQQAGVLQGKINIQRNEVKKLIEKHQSDINDFLAYAGYKYKVEITEDNAQSQLKLLHLDCNNYLNGGKQHLSFGERNAFAIVLFMYECLAKKTDLIILDDPISSFDKNKKYAILEMLFRRESKSCFKGKTVLMLTHDVEPIIDTVKSVAKQFNNQTQTSFLKYTSGTVIEILIEKNDIQTFSEICRNALKSSKDDIIKAVYLRRYLEITNDKGDAYQILSNLFHKRSQAIDAREQKESNDEYPKMNHQKFKEGCSEINSHIGNFDYQCFINRVSSQITLESLYNSCNNGYEKLQIFRLFGLDVNNSVIQKFINETYHIENEFICQLDPEKFDTIPAYVIKECNEHIGRHSRISPS